MATYTPVPIKIAEKSKAKSVKSLEQIVLESVKKDSRGFFLWHDLIEQFEQHFRLTRIQAAIEIRSLINRGKLFLVPCHMTGEVASQKTLQYLHLKYIQVKKRTENLQSKTQNI